jgi:hypothetical protein
MELTTACKYFSCSKLLESAWDWPGKGAGAGGGQVGRWDGQMQGRTEEGYLEKVRSEP